MSEVLLGKVLQKKGEPVLAVRALTRAATMDPNNPITLWDFLRAEHPQVMSFLVQHNHDIPRCQLGYLMKVRELILSDNMEE